MYWAIHLHLLMIWFGQVKNTSNWVNLPFTSGYKSTPIYITCRWSVNLYELCMQQMAPTFKAEYVMYICTTWSGQAIYLSLIVLDDKERGIKRVGMKLVIGGSRTENKKLNLKLVIVMYFTVVWSLELGLYIHHEKKGPTSDTTRSFIPIHSHTIMPVKLL